MANEVDYYTLSWVKSEIDEALNQARVALEAFAAAPEEPGALQPCIDQLHQVYGTLHMVELQGPAQLVAEMERAAQALQSGAVAASEGGGLSEPLMRSILVLPDYLAQLLAGQRDMPTVLLPLINELRAGRAEEQLGEYDLFTPDLSVAPPPCSEPPEDGLPEDLAALVRKLRPHYQSALARLLQKSQPVRNLKRLAAICGRVQCVASATPVRQLFWVAGRLCEGLAGAPDLHGPGAQLLGALDRHFKALAAGGEEGLDIATRDELVRSMLFRLAEIPASADVLAELEAAFRLNDLRPPEDVVIAAQERLAGPNADLLKTVGRELQDNLVRIKDALDIFLRSEAPDPAELVPLGDALTGVADTLSVLGMAGLAATIRKQASTLAEMGRSGVADEERLLEVADALLATEAALDHPDQASADTGNADFGQGSPAGARSDLIKSVIDEAKVDLGKSKDAIVEFLTAPDDVAPLLGVPNTLSGISGSMAVLDLQAAAALLDACARFVLTDLIEGTRPPEEGMLDTLADALAAIEYYLEAVAENWANPDSILEMARSSVEQLGCSVLDGHVPLAPVETPADEADVRERAGDEADALADGPTGQESAVASDCDDASGGLPPTEDPPARAGDELDEEIFEIFFEEAQEELGNIARLLPKWRAAPDDRDTLRDLRRSFHTLKGSGRLVGAADIGEFAWAFENLLNRVTDGAVAPQPEMFALLEQARAMLPDLFERFRSRAAAADEVGLLMEQARALAEGRAPAAVPLASPVQPAATGPSSETDAEGAVADAEDPGVAGPEDEAAAGTPGDGETGEAPAIPDTQTAADGPELPTIDPVLLDIYSKESAGHLGEVRKFLAACGEQAPCNVTDALIRAIHTLHGSSRTAAIRPVAELSGALEDHLKRLQRYFLPLDDKLLQLLEDSVEYIEKSVSQLHQPGEVLADQGHLLDRLTALRQELRKAEADALPDPVPDPVPEEQAATPEAWPERPAEAAPTRVDCDPDLLDVFLEEADEILENSENLLQQWRAAPDNQEALEGLQRELHTLKGGARMTGIRPVGDLGHAIESALAAVVDGHLPVSSRLLGLIEQAQDRLSGLIEKVKHGTQLDTVDDLLAGIDDLLASGSVVPEGDEDGAHGGADETYVTAEGVAPVAERSAEEDAPAAAAEAPVSERAEPLDSAEAPAIAHAGPVDSAAAMDDGERRTRGRVQHEQVRVRADLLDALVNNAGEVSIYRSRLEQQVNDFGSQLGELDETVSRLREQLRRFDMQTEAQIQSRYEGSVGRASEDFDPLEFDRFTEMQQLSRSMLESLSDLDSLRRALNGLKRETETLLLQQARINTELQEGLMRTRMLPFGTYGPRLRRIVRQTASELGKLVELRLPGGGQELDRAVLDRMLPPVEHMLRNAIAHGIEGPETRREAGKPETGTVSIDLSRDGSDVVLEVRDDGRGFDLAAIRERAVKRGLMTKDSQLSDEDVMQFVLESGFSTAEGVSQIAGRGVGMDVVNSEIKQLGGSLHIASVPGQGTTFMVRLPLTLALTRTLMVHVGDELFAIPLPTIEGILRLSPEEVAALQEAGTPTYSWLGHDYRFLHLAKVMGMEVPSAGDAPRKLPLLMVRTGEQRAAVLVEGLMGSREAVVKSVGPQLSTLRAVSGATILGDGTVVLILDLPALIRHGIGVASEAGAAPAGRMPTVMVVDDSITVRKVTSRLLERHNMHVLTAKDGVDALALLGENIPDVMLLDIEMPRMDGYELATHMRNQEHLRDVPIIMITSRAGDKHRERAMTIGVNKYMGKPYQEAELLENIEDLLGDKRLLAQPA